MKSYKTIIGIAAICLCLMSFGFIADDADAAGVSFGDKEVTYGGFTDMDDGKLTVYVSNDGTAACKVKVVVKDYSSGNVEGSSTADVPAGAVNQAISVSFGYGSDGYEYVKAYLYDVTSGTETLIGACGPFEIEVEHSIWKDWVTYLVVVLIVIAIIIIAYFYIRGAPDRAAKKAAALQGNSKAAPAQKTKYDAGSGRKSKRN